MNNLSICVQAKHFPAVGKALPKCAIADLSMSVQAGEFVCLIGPVRLWKNHFIKYYRWRRYAVYGKYQLQWQSRVA